MVFACVGVRLVADTPAVAILLGMTVILFIAMQWFMGEIAALKKAEAAEKASKEK